MRHPNVVLWPKSPERPKTAYLKRGLKQLGIPVEEDAEILTRIQVPSNSLGPLVYPIVLRYAEHDRFVWFDIGTNPDTVAMGLLHSIPSSLYFKIHVRQAMLDRNPRICLIPNSPSTQHFFDNTESLREPPAEYTYDVLALMRNTDRGLRLAVCKELQRHPEWRTRLGLVPFQNRGTIPDDLRLKRLLKPLRHWAAQRTSKLNVALAGGWALPWCSFRHIELWGMGGCCLTSPLTCALPGNPKNCWVEFKDDMSDFVEVVSYYLRNPKERVAIAKNGQRYFDRHLTPRAMASCLLGTVAEKEESNAHHSNHPDARPYRIST